MQLDDSIGIAKTMYSKKQTIQQKESQQNNENKFISDLIPSFSSFPKISYSEASDSEDSIGDQEYQIGHLEYQIGDSEDSISDSKYEKINDFKESIQLLQEEIKNRSDQLSQKLEQLNSQINEQDIDLFKLFEEVMNKFKQQRREYNNSIQVLQNIIQEQSQLPKELEDPLKQVIKCNALLQEVSEVQYSVQEKLMEKIKQLRYTCIKLQEDIDKATPNKFQRGNVEQQLINMKNKNIGEKNLKHDEFEQFKKDFELLNFLYEEKKQENENLIKEVILLKVKLEESIETNAQLYQKTIIEFMNYSSKQNPSIEIEKMKQQFEEQKILFQKQTVIYNEQAQQQQHFNLTIPEFQLQRFQYQKHEEEIISKTDYGFSKTRYKLKPLSARKTFLQQSFKFPFQFDQTKLQ